MTFVVIISKMAAPFPTHPRQCTTSFQVPLFFGGLLGGEGLVEILRQLNKATVMMVVKFSTYSFK